MPFEDIHLEIPPRDFLAWYRGDARHVLARTVNGRILQFPAAILQRFISPNGIHGTFRLSYDSHFRFCNIQRVDDRDVYEGLA